MDQSEEDLMNFILEESLREISYGEHLEQQKALLLAQREVEDWKRLVYETERCREQYLREDRLVLKQKIELRNLTYRLNEPRLEIVIDQGLERWMEDDGEEHDYQPEMNKLRSRIDRMKQQETRYRDISDKIQKSKSHQMAKEASRIVREEENKIEESQKRMDDLWKARYAEARKEWREMEMMIVELSQTYTEITQMDMDKEAALQNNEIKRVKIVQLHEEIKQARIEQEEEAKRREIELNERLLIPMKITPMTLENTMFKNPNDFPALIDKIESTRKSYEQIFKRPEYIDLRKLRKKNKKSRSKRSAQFDLLFSGPKRKDKVRKSQTQTSATAEATTKTTTAEEAASQSPSHPKQSQQKVVAKELPSNGNSLIPPVTKSDKPSVDRPTPKCLLQPEPLAVTCEQNQSNEPPVTNKRKAPQEVKAKSDEDQQKPICNVQGQRTRQRSAPSLSQPEVTVVIRDKIESEPPRKRLVLETKISSSAPSREQEHWELKKPHQVQKDTPEKPIRKSKPKKIAFKQQMEQFEMESDSFSFSPEKSDRKTKSTSKQQPIQQEQNCSPSPPPQQRKQQPPAEPLDFEPHAPQQQTEDDIFSFGSASPPLESRQSKDDDGAFFDTVSRSGSVSSFDMEDRESDSDLGFDLSPLGPRTNNPDKREGGGSDGNTGGDSDFDFLASPPQKAAPSGSRGGGRKGQDSFEFMDDDSGTGFDFF